MRRIKKILKGLAVGAGVWVLYNSFLPPISTLMLGRWLIFERATRDFVPLEDISPHLKRAVIVAEDGKFCDHHGVDWQALQNAVEDAVDEDGGPMRGASTLTMQVVKNLFLWPGRSYLRKTVEIPLALVLDGIWSKRRIMEVYLNVAEFGDGVFGAEAASRRYFGKSAAALTGHEAALLAATLPSPLRRNPARPSGYMGRYAATIGTRAGGADTVCLR